MKRYKIPIMEWVLNIVCEYGLDKDYYINYEDESTFAGNYCKIGLSISNDNSIYPSYEYFKDGTHTIFGYRELEQVLKCLKLAGVNPTNQVDIIKLLNKMFD